MTKKRTLGLGTLLAVLAASAVLAAPGGAAKPSDSMSCSISSGTTFTWTSGTTQIVYDWADSSGNPTGNAEITPLSNGPGSENVATPANSATLNATYYKKRGLSFKMQPVACTA